MTGSANAQGGQRTVLVTGGAGFVGSYVAQRLGEAGHRVVLFDLNPPGPQAEWVMRSVRENIVFEQGGIEDLERLTAVFEEHRPDQVVHIAAVVGGMATEAKPLQALRINVEGTVNVLEASRATGVGRIVNYSTVSVLPTLQYQPADVRHPIVLESEGCGVGFYGAAKMSGEVFCFAHRDSFGTDFITLRPSAVYGFGMQLPLFVKPMVENSLAGEPSRFENGLEFRRDYTHVKDVADITIRALELPADRVVDRIFYAATGRDAVSTERLVEIVREVIPGADIEVGSGLTEAQVVDLRYRGRVSLENAREQLGFEPKYADLKAGIEDYVAMYSEYMAHESSATAAR
jgi:nucleoside-diphosphate-sugar epimerase